MHIYIYIYTYIHNSICAYSSESFIVNVGWHCPGAPIWRRVVTERFSLSLYMHIYVPIYMYIYTYLYPSIHLSIYVYSSPPDVASLSKNRLKAPSDERYDRDAPVFSIANEILASARVI